MLNPTSPPPTGGPGVAIVLLAAGSGTRVGAGRNKVLLPLAGEPVFAWSLRRAAALPDVAAVVLVVRADDRPAVLDFLDQATGLRRPADLLVVVGGQTRHASERNALVALEDYVDTGAVDVVAIHDTARPLASADLFEQVIRTAREHGGALPVVDQVGLLPRVAGEVADAGDRLVAVQTPQAFRARELLRAYELAERDGFEGTDTASCVERYSDLMIGAVASDALNIKVTFPEDIALADRLLEKAPLDKAPLDKAPLTTRNRSGSPEPER